MYLYLVLEGNMRISEKTMVVIGNKNISISNPKLSDITINSVSIFLKGDKFKGG